MSGSSPPGESLLLNCLPGGEAYDRVHPSFLIRYLGSKEFYGELRSSSFGTTNRQRIGEKAFLASEIPLPPLAEQERMVRILDEMDALRDLGTQARQRAASLVGAVFNSMFGDLAANPHGWPMVTLGDVGGPGQYGLNAAGLTDADGVRFIRITDINENGRLERCPPAFVSLDERNLDSYTLANDDILIARSGATAGKSYLHEPLPHRAVFAGYLIRFRIDPLKAHPVYVSSVLRTREYWAQLNSHKRAAAQPNVNAKQLASIQLALPPLELQRKYATHVVAIHALQDSQAARHDRMENLFESGLRYAFLGTL